MLVVIEAPGKLKKIREYSGATVFATVGHYYDLPDREIGVDLETLDPVFIPKESKPGLINDLIAKAKGQDVIVATDPDREGYAIGTMVWQDVKKVAKSVKRAEFREISAKVVAAEIARAVPMEKTNLSLYDAFLGRRIGDRLIGYLLTPLASSQLGKATPSWSVGRVQSPALRLIGEREREIRAFVSGVYYLVGIQCDKDDVSFTAWWTGGRLTCKVEAESLLAKIASSESAQVVSVVRKNRTESPKPPFTTSSLQMAASTQLGFAPELTMQLAQKLYEAGLTTYHRTDSVRIADEFIEEIRAHVIGYFGEDYVPAKPYSHKTKNSQADAHEGIRPTHVHPLADCKKTVLAESLGEDHARLYDLIMRRALASQMSAAQLDTTTALLRCNFEEFKANGRVLVFDGFKKIWAEDDEPAQTSESSETKKEKESEEDSVGGSQSLPDLFDGEEIEKLGDVFDERSTKAPPRYTEAALIRKLEDLGIGRPSTYATIMKRLKDQAYVVIKARKFNITERGEKLLVWLESTTPWLIDYEMTRKLEEYLDKVEDGSQEWKKLAERIMVRIREAGGGKIIARASAVTSGTPSAPRQLSEKQKAIIDKNADKKVKKSAEAGDYATCKKWLDSWFAEKAKKE
ncbi:type I DNA topoisomerase (plasmid) [Trichlorobacter lovleyi]|uniref:type IA DNA topoisomerase n=1 Tax=Trichlorobacter lovleyi TaxID=313985 RepID=UPI00223F71F3|nr:type IA DNA topoisomerase [Trichlorobacter lovleyi]QOX80788.1 type I DNA topoisomerase [Trichlorobacter lovleyi]